MKKKRILLIVFLVGLVAAYFVYDNFLKTAPSMKRLDAEYQVNAVPFYSEFDENEEAANAKYLNKIVEVKGIVESVETPEGRLPIISLKTDGFGVVKCTMESALDDDELDRLKPNATVTLRAECIGVLLDVLLIRSIIIE